MAPGTTPGSTAGTPSPFESTSLAKPNPNSPGEVTSPAPPPGSAPLVRPPVRPANLVEAEDSVETDDRFGGSPPAQIGFNQAQADAYQERRRLEARLEEVEDMVYGYEAVVREHQRAIREYEATLAQTEDAGIRASLESRQRLLQSAESTLSSYQDAARMLRAQIAQLSGS